jgi:hypothetical protein
LREHKRIDAIMIEENRHRVRALAGECHHFVCDKIAFWGTEFSEWAQKRAIECQHEIQAIYRKYR